jgi:hypothetical protein
VAIDLELAFYVDAQALECLGLENYLGGLEVRLKDYDSGFLEPKGKMGEIGEIGEL